MINTSREITDLNHKDIPRGWISSLKWRPGGKCTVEVLCDGGQFVGQWSQEAECIDGHFFYQDINLDNEVFAWRFPEAFSDISLPDDVIERIINIDTGVQFTPEELEKALNKNKNE